jgi:hypothetical protein
MTPFAEQLLDVWRILPAAVLLLLILWAGHKGWWYWDAGVRRLVEQLENERDVWRTMACALLAKEGVQLPNAFTTMDGEIPLMKVKTGRRPDDRDDPWKPT